MYHPPAAWGSFCGRLSPERYPTEAPCATQWCQRSAPRCENDVPPLPARDAPLHPPPPSAPLRFRLLRCAALHILGCAVPMCHAQLRLPAYLNCLHPSFLPGSLMQEVVDLIDRCTLMEPSQRPSAKEIVQILEGAPTGTPSRAEVSGQARWAAVVLVLCAELYGLQAAAGLCTAFSCSALQSVHPCRPAAPLCAPPAWAPGEMCCHSRYVGGHTQRAQAHLAPASRRLPAGWFLKKLALCPPHPCADQQAALAALHLDNSGGALPGAQQRCRGTRGGSAAGRAGGGGLGAAAGAPAADAEDGGPAAAVRFRKDVLRSRTPTQRVNLNHPTSFSGRRLPHAPHPVYSIFPNTTLSLHLTCLTPRPAVSCARHRFSLLPSF